MRTVFKWADFYLNGVSGSEVEEALLVKLPPIDPECGLRGFETVKESGRLREGSISAFLHGAFSWSRAPDGFDFWEYHWNRSLMIDSVEVVTKIRETRKLFEEGKI